MSPATRAALVAVLLRAASAAAATPPDAKGSSDHPAFERFPGCYIDGYDERAFAPQEFRVTKGRSTEKVTIEGKYFKIRYKCPRDLKYTSVQVVRNYVNAVKKAGGEVPYEVEKAATYRFSRGGTETWARIDANLEVSGSPPAFDLVIVEKEAMEQVITADAMTKGLRADGRIALYGIHFDTGSSVVKAESESTLVEIASALAADPALRLHVVGHTDMVGDAGANLKLSEARAAAVVAALTTKHKVAAGRLTSAGAGPYAPVATNRTEAGRAANRRVELVDAAVK
jgi:outer membrane protein OmpA-like peptidoglycan-associated protein